MPAIKSQTPGAANYSAMKLQVSKDKVTAADKKVGIAVLKLLRLAFTEPFKLTLGNTFAAISKGVRGPQQKKLEQGRC